MYNKGLSRMMQRANLPELYIGLAKKAIWRELKQSDAQMKL